MDRRSGERRVRRRGQPRQSVALFLLNGRSKTRDKCSLQRRGSEMEPARRHSWPCGARFPEKNLSRIGLFRPEAGFVETRAPFGPTCGSCEADRPARVGRHSRWLPQRRPFSPRPLNVPQNRIPETRAGRRQAAQAPRISPAHEHTAGTRRGYPRLMNTRQARVAFFRGP